MTPNLAGCWTCRIRRKTCSGRGPTNDCSDCLKLNIECLQGYGERLPDEYRTRRVNDGITAWTRQTNSRSMPEPLSISTLARCAVSARTSTDIVSPSAHRDGSQNQYRQSLPQGWTSDAQQINNPPIASEYAVPDSTTSLVPEASTPSRAYYDTSSNRSTDQAASMDYWRQLQHQFYDSRNALPNSPNSQAADSQISPSQWQADLGYTSTIFQQQNPSPSSLEASGYIPSYGQYYHNGTAAVWPIEQAGPFSMAENPNLRSRRFTAYDQAGMAQQDREATPSENVTLYGGAPRN